jgi:hypothetical protein
MRHARLSVARWVIGGKDLPAASIDTQWANEVTIYTVAKIVLPTGGIPSTGLFHVPRR